MIKEVIVVEGKDDITAVKAAVECEVRSSRRTAIRGAAATDDHPWKRSFRKNGHSMQGESDSR